MRDVIARVFMVSMVLLIVITGMANFYVGVNSNYGNMFNGSNATILSSRAQVRLGNLTEISTESQKDIQSLKSQTTSEGLFSLNIDKLAGGAYNAGLRALSSLDVVSSLITDLAIAPELGSFDVVWLVDYLIALLMAAFMLGLMYLLLNR